VRDVDLAKDLGGSDDWVYVLNATLFGEHNWISVHTTLAGARARLEQKGTSTRSAMPTRPRSTTRLAPTPQPTPNRTATWSRGALAACLSRRGSHN
jgi:hypothetical protein